MVAHGAGERRRFVVEAGLGAQGSRGTILALSGGTIRREHTPREA